MYGDKASQGFSIVSAIKLSFQITSIPSLEMRVDDS